MHKETEISKKDTPAMFDNIAETYDKLNHILSFGLDRVWRRKFVQKLKFREYETIVDIACGTGDLLVELQNLNAKKHFAIDPAENMLEIAKTKLPNVEFIVSTAENIPLQENSCNLITVSFGIRNFSSLIESFNEFYRILKPNGIVSIMEFSQPKFFLFKWGFIIYLKLFLPIIGKMVSKDKSAYKYLQSSIFDFAKNIDVFKELENQNFTRINQTN
ncbi:MAG: bifunctional demethylmenaquinone methyltransferase/2-methoxy-6-polyprenyl-1,4-benzoquinol methylase UbiE, partial [Bacteroidales bacterium]|nr:bifunctional demethylmenaquinone methyltransferase/2-methoxy-6-polyprenyl-1,4-benzoquinol methylase UbiE [Bacteroidales bacterium]